VRPLPRRPGARRGHRHRQYGIRLAPLVRRVVGLDLTREMLDVAGRISAERKIENVDWVIGDACVLPFPDETFDIYVVRAAPHHFHDIDFLDEAFRVLRPGRDALSSTARRRRRRETCCTRSKYAATPRTCAPSRLRSGGSAWRRRASKSRWLTPVSSTGITRSGCGPWPCSRAGR